MATTTNYSWTTPDDTALVKDGAAAIRSLGTAIDTTTKNLNPSTTLGDIEYRSSTANTNTRLAIGSTGNVLTVSGGVPVWAAPAGGGKVLQVVNATYSTSTAIASTTKTDTGLSASITPTLNTSKILVLVSQHVWVVRSSERVNGGGLYLLRGSTEIWNGSDQLSWHNFGSGFMQYGTFWTLHYYDSPATTSSTTYKTQGDSWIATDGGSITFQQNSVTSSITLLEIGA